MAIGFVQLASADRAKDLFGPRRRVQHLGKRDVVHRVPVPTASTSPLVSSGPARSREWSRASETGSCAPPDALEQDSCPQARLEHQAREDKSSGRPFLRPIHSEVPGEYGEARKHDARRKSGDRGSIDRRPQRALTRRQVARTTVEECEAIVEPRKDLLRVQDRCASRGELDREGQSIEATAECDDGFGLPVQDEARSHSLSSIDEELDRRVIR